MTNNQPISTKSFEYTMIEMENRQCDESDIIKKMNEIGNDGWELLTVTQLGSYHFQLFFKRELRGSFNPAYD